MNLSGLVQSKGSPKGFTLTLQVTRWVHDSGIMNPSGLVQNKGSPKGFTLTLQETRWVHDSMNRPKINLLLIFTFYIFNLLSSFNF